MSEIDEQLFGLIEKAVECLDDIAFSLRAIKENVEDIDEELGMIRGRI